MISSTKYILLAWSWFKGNGKLKPVIANNRREANAWLNGKAVLDPGFDRFVLVFPENGNPYFWGGPGI